jgi:hypothetical protein
MHRRRLVTGAAAIVSFAISSPIAALAQPMQKGKGGPGIGPASKGGGAGSGPIPRTAAIAAWKNRIEGILGRGRLPIIDVQASYVRGMTKVEWLVQQMRALDVAQIVFASALEPDSAAVIELQHKYPEYVIPASSSGEFPRWWKGPGQFVASVARELASGAYYMMGEHEFRHYPSPEQAAEGKTDRDITIDIAGPAGQALFQLSETTGVAFQIHYEIEDRLLPPLESMLERYPKAKVIWCHLAMIRYPDRSKKYGPAYVASLIERFPNLYFDLATPLAGNVYKPSGARDGTLYEFPSNAVKPAWKEILERHPERFLAASDYRPPVEQHYPFFINAQRKLLGQLSARTREMIAFRNAWRLVTGSDWAA